MWKKPEEEPSRPLSSAADRPTNYGNPTPRDEPRRTGGTAVIGQSIRIEGDVRGEEDLLIEGEVEGNVNLEKNSVTIGPSGRIKADVHGRNINVEGKVQGNLFADEQVVVRESGEVRGNITAPRVSLEDGAKFKGAIDMEPKASKDRGGNSDRAAAERPASAGAARTGGGGPSGHNADATPASASGSTTGATAGDATAGDKETAGKTTAGVSA